MSKTKCGKIKRKIFWGKMKTSTFVANSENDCFKKKIFLNVYVTYTIYRNISLQRSKLFYLHFQRNDIKMIFPNNFHLNLTPLEIVKKSRHSPSKI